MEKEKKLTKEQEEAEKPFRRYEQDCLMLANEKKDEIILAAF